MHAVVELVNKIGSGVGPADGVVNVVAKGLAASHAFYKYDSLAKAHLKNSGGNLREMVVSADAKVVYDLTVKYSSKIERVNTYATIAVALAGSAILIQGSRDGNSVIVSAIGLQNVYCLRVFRDYIACAAIFSCFARVLMRRCGSCWREALASGWVLRSSFLSQLKESCAAVPLYRQNPSARPNWRRLCESLDDIRSFE